MANVVLIYVAHLPDLLHHNNVGVTYVGTSNLKIELVRFVPLYFVAMLQSMVTIIKVPFATTPAHTIISMKSRPWE